MPAHRLTLIDNWRKVLRQAWSMRLTILAAGLSGLEVVLPMFQDSIPRGTFAAAAILVSIGSAVARVVAQPKMHE